MSEVADRLFDFLPDDGSKVSGGQVRDALDISHSEYKEAKESLNLAGIVELGRGRGGTIARIVGAQKPAPNKKVTKAEKMQFARESRLAKVRERQLAARLRVEAKKIGEENFPDADKVEVQVGSLDGLCYVYPWYDGRANTYRVWIDL